MKEKQYKLKPVIKNKFPKLFKNKHEEFESKRLKELYDSGFKPVHKNLGRPTKYIPEYCDLIIQVADDPNCITLIQEFCSRINVPEHKVTEWANRYPDFKNAYEISKAVWEKKFSQRCFEENKSPTFFKFMMIRQRGIQVDHSEVLHSINNVAHIQKLLSDEQDSDKEEEILDIE